MTMEVNWSKEDSLGGDAAVLITSSESSHFLPTRLKKNILDQTRVALQRQWTLQSWVRMFSLSRTLVMSDTKSGQGNDGEDDGSSSSDSDSDTESKRQSRQRLQQSGVRPARKKQVSTLLAKIKNAQTTKDSKPIALRDNFIKSRTQNRFASDMEITGPPPSLHQILNGEPFGIFTEEDYKKNRKEPVKTLFDEVAEEEKNIAYKQLPFSAFDEQIQWTKEGKMWHFPIDNEQGWEEEKKYSFQDHVFFDDQMKDFPKKGPIRHFMEIVTSALAKNHHLSVKEKHETIEWYKKYFMEHEELLMEKFGEDGIIKHEEKL